MPKEQRKTNIKFKYILTKNVFNIIYVVRKVFQKFWHLFHVADFCISFVFLFPPPLSHVFIMHLWFSVLADRTKKTKNEQHVLCFCKWFKKSCLVTFSSFLMFFCFFIFCTFSFIWKLMLICMCYCKCVYENVWNACEHLFLYLFPLLLFYFNLTYLYFYYKCLSISILKGTFTYVQTSTQPDKHTVLNYLTTFI